MKPDVEKFLKSADVNYVIHKHIPVATVAASRRVCAAIPGLHCKNLFLKEKRGDNLYLLTMPAHKRLDFKAFQAAAGLRALTFAKPDVMWDLMKIKPGSVSPLGLINDTQNRIKLFVDKEVWDAEIVGFHPNDNAATLEMTHENFEKVLNALGNEWEVVEIEAEKCCISSG